MNKFVKTDGPEKDAAGRRLTENGKLVDQPARSGERPQDRVTNTHNLGLQNGICGLHGVKHAGPCPAQIEEVPVETGKGSSHEESNTYAGR
jgi:hypothetical protein